MSGLTWSGEKTRGEMWMTESSEQAGSHWVKCKFLLCPIPLSKQNICRFWKREQGFPLQGIWAHCIQISNSFIPIAEVWIVKVLVSYFPEGLAFNGWKIAHQVPGERKLVAPYLLVRTSRQVQVSESLWRKSHWVFQKRSLSILFHDCCPLGFW